MDLNKSLYEWLQTFELMGKHETIHDLCDGVAVAHVLTQISPEFFKSEWFAKIETDCGTNWRLRVSNLRKVYEGVVDFYSEVLDKQINDKLLPNVTVIGRDYNYEQLGLLLQLILGCAINCHRKDDFIEVMTSLDLEVQHGLRTAIQQMETIDDSTTVPAETTCQPSDRLTAIETDLNPTLNAQEVERCRELESLIDKIKDEKFLLQVENEKLTEQLKNSGTYGTSSRHKDYDNEEVFQRLNQQINALQSDLSKMEELKEDYRLNAELREEEVNKLRQQMDQMVSKLSDFKKDRDELDRLRYLNEEVERYKTMSDVHKKKIEELNESKRQLKLIEERNVTLTKRICELEDETKKLSVLKGQIELYKKQKEDLRLKLSEESYRADKAEDETKRINTKFEELLLEREKHNNEISDLKVALNQYKGSNDTNTNSMDAEYSPALHTNAHTVELMQKSHSDFNNITEKLIRFEFENSKLKEKLRNSDDERVKLLESQLEDEKVRVSRLESENRLINQRIIQLEGQISDLQSVSEDDQMQTFQDIVKQKEVTLEATKSELHDARELISSLKVILAKKEEELAEKDDQYRKYVNKAKIALDQMSGNIASGTSITSSSDIHSNDINYWKQLAQQKDVELYKLKTDYEKANTIKEMEERLMTISFHNLSSNLQRKSAEDRIRMGSLNSTPNSASFLARQRQASTRKYNMPGVSQSEFFD